MKLRNLIAAIGLLASGTSFGAAGMFSQFVFTTTSGTTPLTFYDIGAVTGNPDFQGSNLGTFTVGSNYYLGGQQRSYKDNGTDVTGHGISWRVYSGSPSGSFATVAMPFQFNTGVNNDQQWGGDSQGSNADPIEISTNILAGLPNGTYTLEVFTFITTNNVNEAATVFNNVGGSNYQASFTVIPEPASAMLGILGSVLLLRRRK
ncbi:MAG: hypothetical protein ABIT37_13765 [Luteolibacter sp.]